MTTPIGFLLTLCHYLTMPNLHFLCEELVEALDQCQRPYGDQPESALVWKARAALAEQPVGPTDEELWEAWGCFEHEPFSKEDTIMQLREFLARWGQS